MRGAMSDEVKMAVRKCAKATCWLCAESAPWSNTPGLEEKAHKYRGVTLPCHAYGIRLQFPEVFEGDHGT